MRNLLSRRFFVIDPPLAYELLGALYIGLWLLAVCASLLGRAGVRAKLVLIERL